MLLLLALLILGMVWVASALVDKDAASRESLYGALARLEPVSPVEPCSSLTFKALK